MFPYLSEFVGQPGVEIVLGKGSCNDSVALWLEDQEERGGGSRRLKS